MLTLIIDLTETILIQKALDLINNANIQLIGTKSLLRLYSFLSMKCVDTAGTVTSRKEMLPLN